MKHPMLDLIQSRRSHRKYTSQQLTQPQLCAIMDAALASPSANNRQPWHFSVVQDSVLLNRLSEQAAKGAMNRDSAQRSPRYDDPDFQVFYHAPTVVFLSAPRDLPIAMVDCGIAVYGMALAAESLGLGSVILGLPRDAFSGPNREELESALHFPEGYGFVIALAVGHPADEKAPPEKHPEKISIIR